MDGFWRPCGRIFGPFWGYVELKNRLGSSLRALLRLKVDFLSSTPTILEGFGEVFGDISLSFVDINFTMDFYMILR